MSWREALAIDLHAAELKPTMLPVRSFGLEPPLPNIRKILMPSKLSFLVVKVYARQLA